MHKIIIERERMLAQQQRELEARAKAERAVRVRNMQAMARAFGRVVSLEMLRAYDYNACK